MEIKILGTGCPKCKKLYKNSVEALEIATAEGSVSKVEDMGEITSYAVMMTPALVIDEEVISSGKVLSAEEIAELITERGNE
mgnify:CR=1 FL=1